MSSKLSLYEALIENVTSSAPVLETIGGECWAMAETEDGMGLGMMTPCDSIPAMYPGGLRGLPLKEAAKAAASWNLTEASFGLASCNAFYNTTARMKALDCALPGDVYPTAGLDLRDKTVGIIGHMSSSARRSPGTTRTLPATGSCLGATWCSSPAAALSTRPCPTFWNCVKTRFRS